MLSQERVGCALACTMLDFLDTRGASYPCPPSIQSHWFKQPVWWLATGKESSSRARVTAVAGGLEGKHLSSVDASLCSKPSFSS